MPAQATTYSLTNDWSNINNPNGVWSFYDGSTLLGWQAAPTPNGNAAIPAVANGFWGAGPNLNSDTPEIFKALVNGSAAGETNLDFLAGDVVLHSPNSGGPIIINWTAPSAGAIDFSSKEWYAHSSVNSQNRENSLSVFLGGGSYGSPQLQSQSSDFDRNDYGSFFGSNLTVSAGEQLSFQFSRTQRQPFGSLNGFDLMVNFTPTQSSAALPEPTTWAMMLVGFGLVGFAMRKRSNVRTTLSFA